MPSKIRRAIAAVKDHASIGLAKVKTTTNNDASNLEVAILRVTTHNEVPIDERYVTEVLQAVSSNKSHAATCACAIGRRIGRTSSWVVTLKSLMLVLRVFQDGDPHFPKEVLHAMKRGYKILNLSSFRDDSSSSCPWDFTAFIRTFALYLDERLDCFVTGKLQRRMAYRDASSADSSITIASSLSGWRIRQQQPNNRRTNEPVRDMKPAMLLDRITYWQRLLDRAIATRPTGAARTNRLIQTCLYAIVQESFDLYKDISDGLALLLDSFFHLQYNSCVSAFQTCCKASKQFEELCTFYDLCKGIGVGRTSEYPSVQKVSDELLQTLKEFLKDQSSFPAGNARRQGPTLLLPGPSGKRDDGETGEQEQLDQSERASDYGSVCTSLEDLISVDSGFVTPARSLDDGEQYSDAVEKQSQLDDFYSTNDDGPDGRSRDPGQLVQKSKEEPQKSAEVEVKHRPRESWELALFENATQSSQSRRNDHGATHSSQEPERLVYKSKEEADVSAEIEVKHRPRESWELVLFENAMHSSQSSRNDHGGSRSEADLMDGFGAEASLSLQNYNPFLLDTVETPVNPIGDDDSANAPADADLFAAFANNSGYIAPVVDSNLSRNFKESFDGGSASIAPTFCASTGGSAGNGNGNESIPLDLFYDFGHTSANASGTAGLPGKLGSSNDNMTLDFSAGLNNSNRNGDIPETGLQAKLSEVNGPISPLPSFDNGNNTGSNGLSAFLDDFGTGSSTGNQDETAAFPTGFDNSHGNGLANVEPTFAASFDDGNNMSSAVAIVPFGLGFDDPFSSQSTPTFHATGPAQDQESSQNENDPFGSFSFTPQMLNMPVDEQILLQQQQLWLQNQNKIIAKHLT